MWTHIWWTQVHSQFKSTGVPYFVIGYLSLGHFCIILGRLMFWIYIEYWVFLLIHFLLPLRLENASCYYLLENISSSHYWDSLVYFTRGNKMCSFTYQYFLNMHASIVCRSKINILAWQFMSLQKSLSIFKNRLFHLVQSSVVSSQVATWPSISQFEIFKIRQSSFFM